jgi:hypothetical protein
MGLCQAGWGVAPRYTNNKESPRRALRCQRLDRKRHKAQQYYAPPSRVSSTTRRARRLEEREAHGLQVRFLRERERGERERDGERDRESGEKTCPQCLLSPLTISSHSDCQRKPLTSPPVHLPEPRGVHSRVFCTRRVCPRPACLCHLCARERERSRVGGSNYPSAATLGRSIAERTVA